jgi:hypothetical protein
MRAVLSFTLCAMARSMWALRMCGFIIRKHFTVDGFLIVTTASCVCIAGVLRTCVSAAHMMLSVTSSTSMLAALILRIVLVLFLGGSNVVISNSVTYV